MFVKIKEAVRRYHVSFEQDKSKKFANGRPQTVTTCKIWLLTEGQPQFIGGDYTTLGRKDKEDSLEGFKYALTRALDHAKLGKHVNTLIWQEFHLRHKRLDTVTCREAFSYDAKAVRVCTDFPVHGYIGLHSHQRRTAAEKLEQYRRIYGWRPAKNRMQAEERCHRHGDNITIVNNLSHADQLKEILHSRDKIKDIIQDSRATRAWQGGVWVHDDLTARMSLLAAEEFVKADAELLKRYGVTKIGDAYCIAATKFVPAFKAGDVVTHKGDSAKVVSVDGVLLTIQLLLGAGKVVMDWEVEKVTPHWLRRVWNRLKDATASGDGRTPAFKDDEPSVGHGVGVCGRGDFLGT